MTRVIRLNAFDMNCVAHQSPGLWRHPQDQSWRYKDLAYWTELAKLLERGRFDGLFIADVLGTYDVYGGSDEAAIRQAAQIPVGDPLLLVSAMAAGDGESRVRHHDGNGFRTSLSVRATALHAGSPHQRPHRLERRHRVSACGRAQYGPDRSARPRRALRPCRRVPRGAVQAVGGLVGGRRGAARPPARHLYRPRQGPPHRP